MHNGSMRTTVEMKPEHRSALLALAARRGQKGFSAVLEEALDAYLAGEAARERRRETLRRLRGALSPEDADDLRKAARELRENWR